MSFEFIDLNKSFLKRVTERFVTILINHPRRGARADNIHTFIKKLGNFDFFMLDKLKTA
jgi:hypothetical protein